MGLKGGGPVKLISSQQLADSENFRDLAHMEESDFEGALSFALKMIVDSSHGAKRVDISDFLEIEGSMQEAFFAFHGEHELLRKFLIMFKETGIDEMLQKRGWLAVCHYMSFEPLKMRTLFVRIPGVPPTTVNFLISILRSALVCVGMPTPTAGIDDIDTKIKLWSTVIFKGLLARMYPVQNLLDTWDQSCTIVGDHFTMRLAAHTGLVNPDFALKHFSRCGPEDKTIAVLTFTGALRGGFFWKRSPQTNMNSMSSKKMDLPSFFWRKGPTSKSPFIS